MYRDDYGKLRSVLVLLRHARRLRPDLIYVELFGYSGVVAGILAKLLFGARLGIGNGDDVFSSHAKNGRWFRAIVSDALERLLRRYADLWVVWSPYHARYLRARGARNVVCAPGAVDTVEMAPRDPTALRRQLRLEGRLVVGVVGYFSDCRQIDMVPGWDLISALRYLGDLPVTALMIGDGPGVARLKRLAWDLGVRDRVLFTGQVPHQALPEYYSLLDAGLVTLSNDLDGRFTWTAKLPEYLACNVFPIMTDIERSRSFVRRCGALLPFHGVKDPAYPIRLATLIRELTRRPALLDRRSRGRSIAKSLLHADVAARHVARGIARATGTPMPARPTSPGLRLVG